MSFRQLYRKSLSNSVLTNLSICDNIKIIMQPTPSNEIESGAHLADEPAVIRYHGDDEDEDSTDAFKQRMLELYGSQLTVVDKLRELYEDDDSQAFQDFLDDTTYGALEENTEFLKNARRMRATNSAVEQETIKTRQRIIFDEAKKYVLLEAGLPAEASLDEVDRSRQRIAELLNKQPDSDMEIDDVLRVLGIIILDDEGREVFNYPEGLFPASTDKRWETYLESLLQYFRIERAIKLGTRTEKDKEPLDGARRIAHNAVAHDIDEVLGLSSLPATKWNFEKTRTLVTKMRDMKYPTIETAERDSTNSAIGESLMGLHALKALNVQVRTLQK